MHYHILINNTLSLQLAEASGIILLRQLLLKKSGALEGVSTTHKNDPPNMDLLNRSLNLMVMKILLQQFYAILIGSIASLLDIYNYQVLTKADIPRASPANCETKMFKKAVFQLHGATILAVYQRSFKLC